MSTRIFNKATICMHLSKSQEQQQFSGCHLFMSVIFFFRQICCYKLSNWFSNLNCLTLFMLEAFIVNYKAWNILIAKGRKVVFNSLHPLHLKSGGIVVWLAIKPHLLISILLTLIVLPVFTMYSCFTCITTFSPWTPVGPITTWKLKAR